MPHWTCSDAMLVDVLTTFHLIIANFTDDATSLFVMSWCHPITHDVANFMDNATATLWRHDGKKWLKMTLLSQYFKNYKLYQNWAPLGYFPNGWWQSVCYCVVEIRAWILDVACCKFSSKCTPLHLTIWTLYAANCLRHEVHHDVLMRSCHVGMNFWEIYIVDQDTFQDNPFCSLIITDTKSDNPKHHKKNKGLLSMISI